MAIKKRMPEAPGKGIPIPAGTEQETGITRGETEKVTGPVKLSRIVEKIKKPVPKK